MTLTLDILSDTANYDLEIWEETCKVLKESSRNPGGEDELLTWQVNEGTPVWVYIFGKNPDDFGVNYVEKSTIPEFASITVTNPADSGPGSLRWAIANLSFGGTIDFAFTQPTTITLTSGQLVINKSMTITGPSPNELTISGNNSTRVFEVKPDVSLELRSLTVAEGAAFGSDEPAGGGAIRNLGTVILVNTLIRDSKANWGGGIRNQGVLTATASYLFNNSAERGDGGAIYNEGKVWIRNRSRIYGNTARGGGGILNWQAPTGEPGYVEIIESTVDDNAAINGGGIQNGYEAGVRGTVKIVLAQFADNKASEGGGLRNGQGGEVEITASNFRHNLSVSAYSPPPLNGGGIWNNGTMTIGSTTFLANEAGSGGGALANTDTGVMTINASIFTANKASYSGGIQNGGQGKLTISSSTLSENVAGNYGGGLRNIENGVVMISNTTFSGNSASWGGGISNESTNADALALTDCIVRDNVASSNFSSAGGGIYNSGGELTVTNCLISNNNASDGEGSSGGGIYSAEGTLKLNNTSVTGNNASGRAAGLGGGVYIESGELALVNTSVNNNTARASGTGAGGGLYNASGTMTLANSTYST